MTFIDISFQTDLLDETSPTDHLLQMEEQALLADELGYRGSWFNESHLDTSGQIADPLLFLARISARTTRLLLGTAVVCAPLYDPIRLAESAILLDLLSQGRLRLGVGIGDRRRGLGQAWDYSDSHVDERTLEIIDILVQAFDGGVINYEGRHYSYSGIELSPAPIRKAADVLVAVTDRNHRAILDKYPLDLLAPRLQALGERQAEVDYQRKVHPRGQVTVLRYASISEDRHEAIETAIPWLQKYVRTYRGEDWAADDIRTNLPDIVERTGFVIGTPEEAVSTLHRWGRDRDALALDFSGPGVPHEYSLRSIRLLAQYLSPKGELREIGDDHCTKDAG